MAISDLAEDTGAARLSPPSWLATVLRYGVSASGPVTVSGAHFLASLIFLHALPAGQFGLFSFVMVTVSFGISLNVALIGVAVTRNLVTGGARIATICFQMNWLVCFGYAALLCVALLLGGAPAEEIVLLSLFAGVFTYRWFARCQAFVHGHTGAAIRSDLVYAITLAGGLGFLLWRHEVDFARGSQTLLAAAALSLLPFGPRFFRTQIAALWSANPAHYWPIFRDLTRWSLVGVALTEVTVNIHAYLVTFMAGPSAFALLALGPLLLRPAALMQSALPDVERPLMARAIAACDWPGADRVERNFQTGLWVAWGGNLLLVAALLAFAPALILKQTYPLNQVVLVAALSAAVMAVRCLRVPPAVLLQAAGRFKELAGIGTVSGVVSVVAALIALLLAGPIASLGGVLLGEVVMLLRVQRMARRWKAAHD